MNDSDSEDSSEKTDRHSFLCFLGLHKWKRKTGALCYLPKVVEKRYECVRCGKSRVVFEKTAEDRTLKSKAAKGRVVKSRTLRNESY